MSQKVVFDQTLQTLTSQDELCTQAWQIIRQAALERHNVSRIYLAHHKLESGFVLLPLLLLLQLLFIVVLIIITAILGIMSAELTTSARVAAAGAAS